jgi:hypothetical protein
MKTREAAASKQQLGVELERLKKVDQVGGRVATYAQAMLDNPGQYDLLRATAAEEGLPVNRLPQAFDPAVLMAVRDRGFSIQDRAAQRRQKLQDDERKRLDDASIAQRNAAAAKSRMDYKASEQRFLKLKKEAGEGSPGTNDAKESQNTRRDVMNLRDLDKEFPLPPLNENSMIIDKQYRTITGKLFRWGKNTEGEIGAIPIPTPPRIQRLLGKRPASRTSVKAEEEQ